MSIMSQERRLCILIFLFGLLLTGADPQEPVPTTIPTSQPTALPSFKPTRRCKEKRKRCRHDRRCCGDLICVKKNENDLTGRCRNNRGQGNVAPPPDPDEYIFCAAVFAPVVCKKDGTGTKFEFSNQCHATIAGFLEDECRRKNYD